VLETVAAKAGWAKPPAKGIGRGIAQHACFGSYVAQVVELSVDTQTGKIKVHRVVAAVDCGPVINPDPLVAQIEGAVTMALSTALMEEVRFAKGGVASANFDDYRLIRMSEVPEIEVHMIKSTDKIGGIGEPGVPPLAPAVANAFFNATGVRIRRIPSPRPGCWRPCKKPEVFRRSKREVNFSKAAGFDRRPCFSKSCLYRYNLFHGRDKFSTFENDFFYLLRIKFD
jgi:isoquinoline 1-oxidoreductase beta subunit